PRDHPVLGGTGERLHHGIDLAAPAGAPVRAAGSGTVIAAGPRGAYGHHVRIRHDDTYETAYAHLADYAQGVGPGRRVRQGEVIGYVGSTGRSTGPHLHYEVLVDGVQVDPLALKASLATRLKSGTLGAVRAAGAGIGKVGSAVAAAAASVGGPLGRAASLLWDDGTDRRAAAASK
ncbi:MAG TPA: M23 family metallopeptidase, partial [Geminicoccaceae bacterium]|nr:M23 family metallopeptidase [Geminicoccaceae bacterium]